METTISTIKALFQRFSRCPENVPSRHYRFFVFGNYFYFFDIFTHGTAIPLNSFYGVHGVALFNVGSVLIYILALYFNLQGRLILSLALVLIETVTYVTIQSLVTGNVGINPVLLLMVMVVFFSSIERLPFKLALGITIGIIYALLELQVRYYPPLNQLTVERDVRNQSVRQSFCGTCRGVCGIFLQY